MRTRRSVNLYIYVEGAKSFRPDIQKQRQMENAVRGSAIYGEVNVSVENCVEIKGDYVEKQQICFVCHLKILVRPETFGPYHVLW